LDDNQRLAALTPDMTASDPQWEAFVAREPYFAVIPTPDYLRAHLTPAREEEFFAGGETLVESWFQMIEPLAPDFAPMSVLEYGCGLGRLAFPLAARTGSVTAVDRSPAMLAAARAQAARRGAADIDFLTPDELFATPRKFDLVVCHGALQRMPPDDGLALMRALLARIGPGGFGIFQFPYGHASRLVRASRWLRERLPAVNSLANLLRGKPAGDPFIPTHAYDLYDVLGVLRQASMDATQLFADHRVEPPSAGVFARAPLLTAMPRDTGDAAPAGQPASTSRGTNPPIDVRDVIAKASIDDLNRTAEEYFAQLPDWEHHLAKPFAKAEDASSLLIDTARLLQGLHLKPGMTVLEFGAGSGWLSRWLTQLGCRAILLDVSPTALAIARELYARQPVLDREGHLPAPEFLQFDGRHIDLPDSSVDRVVSFHAFHHVANPDTILREFGRVLGPAGIAAFAEPGRHHSRMPLSQFEMRTYGVVENDVDVHAIWRTARTCGFTDLTLGVYHKLPFHVSLEEFDDLLTGGTTNEKWAASTRVCLRNEGTFFLTKGGPARLDSRSVDGLACQIKAALASTPVVAHQPIVIDATVANTGTAVWLPWGGYGGVAIGAHLYDASGTLVNFDLHCESLADPPREILPGETVRLRVALPPQEPGRYRLELDGVAAGVTWFAQVGSRPVTLPVEVESSR
jgi:SAM-dependent methyltransferase